MEQDNEMIDLPFSVLIYQMSKQQTWEDWKQRNGTKNMRIAGEASEFEGVVNWYHENGG